MSPAPKPSGIMINRAPVLTLWAAVVAERLGHPREAALTLGKAVAGANAQSKGKRLGIFEESAPKSRARQRVMPKPVASAEVELLGRVIRARQTREGLRALDRDRPASPEAVARYLDTKFGDDLDEARAAMTHLAAAFPPRVLAKQAFALYEEFRPKIPAGVRGWGAKGELDLALVRSLAKPSTASKRGE